MFESAFAWIGATVTAILTAVFPGYGDAARAMGPLTRACKGIKKFWGWGSSEMSGARLAER